MQINLIKNKNIPKRINQQGFTLLETLVAIFILTLSITGPVYIASVAFHNTIDSRDNISAQYLAEEVVEVLRNRKDARMLAGNADKFSGITGSANCFNGTDSITHTCVMLRDVATGDYSFMECTNGLCENIPFNPESDIVYGESDTIGRSKFVREFYFQKGKYDSATGDIPDNEIKLVVSIKWKDKAREKVYVLTEHMHAIDYNGYFLPKNI